MRLYKPKTLGLAAIMASTAMLSVGAFGASAALAETVTLHEESTTGPAVPTTETIRGTSSNLVFHTSSGNLECETSTVEGKPTKNPGEPAEGEITEASFTGKETSSRCKTTLEVLGSKLTAAITPTGLPWILKFFANGTTTITSKTGTEVDFSAKLFLGTTEVAHCAYTKTTVEDTFGFNAALVDTITKQVFTLEAGSSSSCPSTGELNGSFTIKTDKGVTVVATKP